MWANLKNANLGLFQLKDTILDDNVIMPDGSKYDKGWEQKIKDMEVPKEYIERWKKWGV